MPDRKPFLHNKDEAIPGRGHDMKPEALRARVDVFSQLTISYSIRMYPGMNRGGIAISMGISDPVRGPRLYHGSSGKEP